MYCFNIYMYIIHMHHTQIKYVKIHWTYKQWTVFRISSEQVIGLLPLSYLELGYIIYYENQSLSLSNTHTVCFIVR